VTASSFRHMTEGALQRLAIRLTAAGLVAGALVATGQADHGANAADADVQADQTVSVTDVYYRAIEKNTRWVETQWDAAKGAYSATNSAFLSVLGNAVLLEYGDYDPALTGVDEARLRDHTMRTIAYYAAANRYNGGSEWGGHIFWDATYESYFVAAARVLWDELDPELRDQIDRIARGEANYMAELGERTDPNSGGWTSNGLDGGYVNDTKLEEMGNQSLAFAPALAYLGDDPQAGAWGQWFDAWSSNLTGLPVADDNNPTVVDGQTVAERNRAQNLYPGYIVENHGSYNPHYHQSAWVYPARNAIHFLLGGQPLPDTLLRQPNGDGMWDTTHRLTTAAGMSAYPMVADRLHLYGRDVLPLAGRHLLDADPYAARAELMLASILEAYVDYPPEGRLTKFSGEPHYEPEARAELAIAYLLHRFADRLPGGDVTPVTEAEFFAAGSGTTDWGAQVGLVAQQTRRALAMAVTKPGVVKFAWLPGHDDWLFKVGGATPFLLPSTKPTIRSRTVRTYSRARDGYDATATVLETPEGYAGFSTLPDGSAVYASTGLGPDEGAVGLYNFALPGIPGLDGDRTFASADGTRTVPAGPTPDGLGDGGLDRITFDPTEIRYLRVQGVRPATQFGYSILTLAARNGAGGPDLALGRPATASTTYPGNPPGNATDGDPKTRWAVSLAGRSDPASWLTVDLGAPTTVDRVEISWESAFGAEYRIQGSDDGQTWRDLRTVTPSTPGTPVAGSWLNVDDRAGFVVRDGNGIWAAPERITLSGGAPSDVLVEAHPATADQTRRLAQAPAPTGGPPALRASLSDGYLSLFNLGDEAISGAALSVPQDHKVNLYVGDQRVSETATTYDVDLPAATARVEAPRFVLTRQNGWPMTDLAARVVDSTRVELTNLDPDRSTQVIIASTEVGRTAEVTLAPGQSRTLTFPGRPLPTADLATGHATYPDSPLPAGMTSPAYAVDGERTTAWCPGVSGRMVVDLGASAPVGEVSGEWTAGERDAWTVSVSDDGLTWRPVGGADSGGSVDVDDTARYVAVQVAEWRSGDAQLRELHIRS
jgi:hypothetical protein